MAKRLGDAYRAYDANDLAGAQDKLARLDETKLVNVDYALWLQGMVALRAGQPAAAIAAFEKLLFTRSSHFIYTT
jgi:hypothetical protein